MANDTSNRGFASMDEDKQREIAKKGGEASHGGNRQGGDGGQQSGGQGNQQSGGQGNQQGGGQGSQQRGGSGNFANDPQRASEAGRKGGQS